MRVEWFGIVLTCLLLNYFGKVALLLRMPYAFENTFYMMSPRAMKLKLGLAANK